MLVRHPEEFTVLFASPEPELDFGGEPVGLKAQGILDVALRLEGARHGLVRAVLACPAGVALAGGASQRPDAGSVLAAPVVDHAEGAGLLHRHASRLRIPV